MNEEQIMKEMNFSDELIEYIQNAQKMESFEAIPAVIEIETEEDSVVSSSTYYYSSY